MVSQMDSQVHKLSEDLVATPHDTVDTIVGQGREATPIRIDFAQRRAGSAKVPGPLANFVSSGDLRGLRLYLLALVRATRKEPWNVRFPSAVWARALGIDLPTTKTAASSISKAWLRIEQRGLIARSRSGRMTEITLLCEDGQGGAYERPRRGFFKLPTAFWLSGPPSRDARWFELLDLPATAMLLVASTLQPGFTFPVERTPERYGFSADTAQRGLASLNNAGILKTEKSYRKEPLAPHGFTHDYRHTLLMPFGHRPAPRPLKRSGSAK